ncbi:MAG: T9SS type A sorting domain-containing protein [Candidatus Marinimicrobia bacterium]|nr:T9SS type A sorting domain-containing protein [Candidatus Neomarinimicrobiota bacterium]MCF7880200.1 T9SS type A sorting domain-containing protein [Candidatus Neomarinimicrobiota bacterium]
MIQRNIYLIYSLFLMSVFIFVGSINNVLMAGEGPPTRFVPPEMADYTPDEIVASPQEKSVLPLTRGERDMMPEYKHEMDNVFQTRYATRTGRAATSSGGWIEFYRYYQWTGSAWQEDTYRYQITYNAEGRPIERLWQDSTNGAWEHTGRNLYTYDTNGYQTEYLSQDWINGAWENDWRNLYTYDTNGYQTEYLRQDWINGAWEHAWQYLYTYDTNGYRTESLGQDWINGAWEHAWRNLYTYDTNGYRTESLGQDWINGAWEHTWRNLYTYDTNGYRTESLGQDWINGAWEHTWQYLYTYDTNGYQTEYLRQDWINGAWEHAWQYLYTYDTNGYQTEYLRQDWINGAWEHAWQYLYTYDTNGYRTESLNQDWINGAWENDWRNLYTYDTNGYQTEYLSQDWINGAWENDWRIVIIYEFFGLTGEFTATPVKGKEPLIVNFTDESTTPESSGLVSWQWDFQNDGTVDATIQNPSYTYTRASNYDVRLVVSDGVDTATVVKQNYITVYPDTAIHIVLTIPDIVALARDTVSIPVFTKFPTDSSYTSAELGIHGYESGLVFSGIDTSNTLTGKAGWAFTVNETDSLLLNWSAGANTISDSGVFVNLVFEVTGAPGTYAPIIVESATFDTGKELVTITNGGVHIEASYVYGDVDGNGRIQAYDASLILQHVAGMITLTAGDSIAADVTLDGSLSAFDASILLQYGVGLVDSLPYDTTDQSVVASGQIAMSDQPMTPGSAISLPLTMENGANLLGLESTVEYNPNHLEYAGVRWADEFNGTLRQIHEKNGRLVMTAAGTQTLAATGEIARLQFHVHENLRVNESKVTLKRLRLNENPVQTDVTTATLSSTTGIGDDSAIPDTYVLHQNHPNPFNPTTTIRYGLPEGAHVTLTVYDLMGRPVAVLANGQQQTGWYTVHWDGHSQTGQPVSTGVYFYRIETLDFKAIRKMVYMK